MDREQGSEWSRTVFMKKEKKHGFDRRVGLYKGRAAPCAFRTKKNGEAMRNQSVINTESGEK